MTSKVISMHPLFVSKFAVDDYQVIEVICKNSKPMLFILADARHSEFPVLRVTMFYAGMLFGKDEEGDNLIKCEIESINKNFVVTQDAKDLLKIRITKLAEELKRCLSMFA